MNFTCQRPFALYGIIFLVPGIILAVLHFRNIVKKLTQYTVKDSNSIIAKRMKHFSKMVAIRTFCISVSWVMLILAYAGFSWGTYLEPVQKSGTAVSLVFDISYSMTADDCTGGLTRLAAAKKYASMLLSHVNNSSFSFVVAKGDGVILVPQTEDRASVETLLDTLSPELMSATGTSLGKGIRAALKSFPSNSSQKNAIWVFTDGEETDGLLENALIDCVKSGISVYLIGFGTERETKTLAGDRKTYILTALRSEKMKGLCANAMRKNSAEKVSDVKAFYIDSTEPGSALQILESIETKNVTVNLDGDEDSLVTYEIKPVKRYSLFLGLGILFLVLSYVITELDPENISSRFHKNAVLFMIVCSMFTSCKGRVMGAKNVLEGSWNLYQRKYNDSVAEFLQTSFDAEETNDNLLKQYAVYDLAVAYLHQNENDEALFRFMQIDDSATPAVRYATYYNCGIIAHRTGDYEAAANCFRNALKIDGTKIEAKINLELSLMKAEKEAKSKENSLNQVSESNSPSTMEQAVFERIREYDKKQWKNSEKKENSNSSQDY